MTGTQDTAMNKCYLTKCQGITPLIGTLHIGQAPARAMSLSMHTLQKAICMQGNSIALLLADMQMQQQFFSVSDSRCFFKSDNSCSMVLQEKTKFLSTLCCQYSSFCTFRLMAVPVSLQQLFRGQLFLTVQSLQLVYFLLQTLHFLLLNAILGIITD